MEKKINVWLDGYWQIALDKLFNRFAKYSIQADARVSSFRLVKRNLPVAVQPNVYFFLHACPPCFKLNK
jgi:hypothetical protein